MTRFGSASVFLTALLGIAVTIGCGSSRSSTYPVTGTVTYNGEPVEGASVALSATEPETRGAVGITDADGRYELTTFEKGDGAMPGEFKVRVFKYDREPEEPEELEAGEDPYKIEDMPDDYEPEEYAESPPPQHLLPKKYSNPSLTPLSFTVEEGENTFDIDLED